MYMVVAFDGTYIANCDQFETALRILRTVPRAARVVTDGLVLLAWKPRKDLESVAAVGQDAGVPWLDRAMGAN